MIGKFPFLALVAFGIWLSSCGIERNSVQVDELQRRSPLKPVSSATQSRPLQTVLDSSGKPTQCGKNPNVFSKTKMRRLTNKEFSSTLGAVFGFVPENIKDLPPERPTLGFDRVTNGLSTSSERLETLLVVGKRIGEELSGDSGAAKGFWSKYFPCRLGDIADADWSKPAAETCLTQGVRKIARAAFRRPLAAADTESLLKASGRIIADGGDRRLAFQGLIQTTLLSPHFVFHVEKGRSVGPGRFALDGQELANRLSYFLWGEPPDAELVRVSEAGGLKTRQGLIAQVERMLKDPKAEAFVADFVSGWLKFDKLHERRNAQGQPLAQNLLESMKGESVQLVRHSAIRPDLPLSELLTAERTYLDDTLAAHYGITVPPGPGFKEVSLRGTGRRGLLTHASFLTLTSQPTRTSVVARGEKILAQFSCRPPPAAPANVQPLESTALRPGASIRERMEAHRSNPSCAGCHRVMDPPGFALEAFGPTGQARRVDEFGNPVSTADVLSDGTAFRDASDFIGRLASTGEFERCFVGKVAVYAAARGLEGEEACVPQVVLDTAAARSLPDVITGLVAHPFFQEWVEK